MSLRHRFTAAALAALLTVTAAPVSRAAHYTLAQGDDPTEGVSFEPLLPLLSRQVGLSDSLGL